MLNNRYHRKVDFSGILVYKKSTLITVWVSSGHINKTRQQGWVNEQYTKTRQAGLVNVPAFTANIFPAVTNRLTFTTRQAVRAINQSIKWDACALDQSNDLYLCFWYNLYGYFYPCLIVADVTWTYPSGASVRTIPPKILTRVFFLCRLPCVYKYSV